MHPSVTVVVVSADQAPREPARLVAGARAKWHPSKVRVLLACTEAIAASLPQVDGLDVVSAPADALVLKRLAATQATGDVIDFETEGGLLRLANGDRPPSD